LLEDEGDQELDNMGGGSSLSQSQASAVVLPSYVIRAEAIRDELTRLDASVLELEQLSRYELLRDHFISFLFANFMAT